MKFEQTAITEIILIYDLSNRYAKYLTIFLFFSLLSAEL